IYIAKWYQTKLLSMENQQKFIPKKQNQHISKSIKHALMLLILLVFARSWYQGTISNFYAFYAIDTYDISISLAQIFIFTFLILLVFVLSWYQGIISNFYAFYAIDTYDISISQAQIFIFTFLILGAIGTFLGGPLADRFGKKMIIFISLIGPAPLALALPFVN